MTPFDPRLTIIAKQAGVKTPHVYHCWQAINATKANFHAGAFAEFAGLDMRHVDAIVKALKANRAMPVANKREFSKGTRLSADVIIDEIWIEWAVGERGWAIVEAQQEARSFIDYWAGVPGAKGVKLDWFATWRNSVRRSNRPGKIATKQSEQSPDQRREALQRRLQTEEMLGRTYEADQVRKEIAAMCNVLPFMKSINQ